MPAVLKKNCISQENKIQKVLAITLNNNINQTVHRQFKVEYKYINTNIILSKLTVHTFRSE